MPKNDYTCTEEPVEKQLEDYKKSTRLWAGIAANRLVKMYVIGLLLIITNSIRCYIYNNKPATICKTSETIILNVGVIPTGGVAK